MSKRKIFIVESGAYFFTARIVKRLNLFVVQNLTSIVLNSLKWLRDNNRISLFAFVVMPNHVHFIFQPKEGNKADKIAHSFTSFTGHEIVKYCQYHNRQRDLDVFFQEGVNRNDREYSVWEDSLIITVDNQYHLLEKMEYIHNNPVNKHWSLCDERGEYLYSSACYYDYGREPLIPIDGIGELA